MSLTQLPAWQALAEHQKKMRDVHMRDLFAADPHRFDKFSLTLGDLLFDYSKNRITEETMSLLVDLARQVDLPAAIEAMFSGEKINTTENRAVLHVALRNRSGRPIYVDGEDVMPKVQAVLDKMERFCAAVRSGSWKGLYGQGHHRRREHRHRRLRSGPAHGHPRPEAVRPRAAAGSFRVERRPDRHRRNAEDARSRNDLVPRRVENFHDAGDDDERTHGPRLVPKARARRARGR